MKASTSSNAVTASALPSFALPKIGLSPTDAPKWPPTLNLYKLLTNNYISPCRAAVLAYINSLQPRTLPAIDADNEAGITDPTAPEEVPAELPSADVSPSCASEASVNSGWTTTEPDPNKKPS